MARKPKLILVHVDAPHFNAGIVVRADDQRVIEAAPILGWTLGKSYGYLTRYFRRKGWTVLESDIP